MPGRGKMVVQGKIWANRTTREVLWSVLKAKNVNSGVLRIFQDKVEGEIAISRGVFIIGGRMRSSSENGYDAVKRLLSMSEGSFQYLDYGDEFYQELDQNLKIRLTTVISVLPNLPQNIEQLAGKNTLGRIRAMDGETTETAEEENLIDRNVLTQLEEWDKRSERFKSAALWSAFLAVACLAGLLYWFGQH